MDRFPAEHYIGPLSRETLIPGLLEFELEVHNDSRGWFKENFQQEKLRKLGLPETFEVLQNNVSFNPEAGTTRGIHAEPWDKFISILHGSVFAAIVDFRAGPNFGRIQTFELDLSKAIYVPRGCGNSFQTLEPNTIYSYLVNDHWRPGDIYPMVNLADQTLAINWPIPLREAIISDKDRSHPSFELLTPMEV